MPLIEIHLLEGRTPEQKKKLLASVTEAVHESIGSPVASIRVWINEFSAEDYMAAGRTGGGPQEASPRKRALLARARLAVLPHGTRGGP